MTGGGQRDMAYAERRARMKPRPFALEPLALAAGVALGVACCPDDHDTLTGDLAERLGVGARHVKRLRQQGMSLAQADTFAIRLNCHPAGLWPDVWDIGREPEPGPLAAPDWMGERRAG